MHTLWKTLRPPSPLSRPAPFVRSVAYPKHHTQIEISDIYNFAAATRGVFVNPALQEPFGLTVIEVGSGLWGAALVLAGGRVGMCGIALLNRAFGWAAGVFPSVKASRACVGAVGRVGVLAGGLGPALHRGATASARRPEAVRNWAGTAGSLGGRHLSRPAEPSAPAPPQAAAHGVPTVATKNGGPVDIMETLHHGVVVDPTDPAAIAEALLRILTDPRVGGRAGAGGRRGGTGQLLGFGRAAVESAIATLPLVALVLGG